MAHAKHIEVRRLLELAIRDGEYGAGEQLPPEQDLAERYRVSYTTARRAVSDLVGADVLERRGRKGTFVRKSVAERLQQTTLQIICHAYVNSANESLIRCATRSAVARGWHVNVVRLASEQQDIAIRAISSGGPALLQLDDVRPGSALSLALRTARNRVVVLNPDLSAQGISTIWTNPKANLDLALDCVRSVGHRNIALIVQLPDNDTDCRLPWQKVSLRLLAQLCDDIHVVRVDTPPGESPMMRAYETITAFLNTRPGVTAVVTLGDEVTMGAMGACRDLNLSIPEDISIVNVGDSPLLQLVTPPVSSVSLEYDAQCDAAISLLEKKLREEGVDNTLTLIPTRLIRRSSVAAPSIMTL